MSKSKLTQTLAVITKKIKWPENKSVGYEGPNRKDKYMNPLLTPPPRSPTTPEDFRYPNRLGHWRPFGYDFTNKVADRYYLHEACFAFFFSGVYCLWFWLYGPDYKLRDWARREAYLRTTKREALGIPLIDKNVVDPERVILPSEEELQGYPVKM